ncbi:hypothetical protein K9M79_04060 [Candidatus Woesearchaeota archaeon]|nr:hypothetical protein [Candidatus Woesearchaeota archaeon]
MISACQLIPSGQTGTGTDTKDIYKGKEGVSVSFVSKMPPTTVYADDCTDEECKTSPYAFYLKIKNSGAHSLSSSGSIYLSGFNTALVENMPKTFNLPDLSGKSREFPDGEESVEKIDEDVVFKIPKNTDTYDLTLLANACYSYKTYSTSQICVDPDPTRNSDDACFASDIKMSDGQGAPIAVSGVQIDSSLNRVLLIIDIKNVGGGKVIKDISECPSPKLSSQDIVNIESVKLAGEEIDCKVTELRMSDKEGKLYCSIDTTGTSAYYSLLELTLNYGYIKSVASTISVKQIDSR